MAVKTYKKGAGVKLSANFNTSEFDCKCGKYCSQTKIDGELAKKLQLLRDKLGKPIHINSAYRCSKHNKNVGGASSSYHLKGKAADIVVSGVEPAEVAKTAETVGFKGIILYTKKKFVHVDVRPSKYFAKDNSKTVVKVSTFGGAAVVCPYAVPTKTLRRGSKGNGVKWAQWHLKQLGYDVTLDGDFGANTRAAVHAFQTSHSLDADGVVGAKTRAALRKAVG